MLKFKLRNIEIVGYFNLVSHVRNSKWFNVSAMLIARVSVYLKRGKRTF